MVPVEARLEDANPFYREVSVRELVSNARGSQPSIAPTSLTSEG